MGAENARIAAVARGLHPEALIRRVSVGPLVASAPRMVRVSDPEQTATRALASTGTRLAHSRRVAARVQEALPLVEPEWRAALGAAAWLHDVGYSRIASAIGFHPLDGARWLRQDGWSDQVTRLVAWHTHSEKEAELRGLAPYDDEFPRPPEFVMAVLTWADLTSTPGGFECEPEDRLERILNTYPVGSVVHEATRASRTLLMKDVALVRVALETNVGQSS